MRRGDIVRHHTRGIGKVLCRGVCKKTVLVRFLGMKPGTAKTIHEDRLTLEIPSPEEKQKLTNS